MKTVLSALAVTVLLALGVARVSADEAVVLVCTPTLADFGFPVPPVFVATCDKSAGVPVACPPPFLGPGQEGVSCAQTLAAFLSLPGYKLANVQPSAGVSVLYTISGP